MESLIQQLTSLYQEISGRLLQLRVSRAQAAPAAHGEIGLVEALIERLQGVSAAAAPGGRTEGTAQGRRSANADAVMGPAASLSPGQAPGARPLLPPLSEPPPSLSRSPVGPGVQPPLATQLQRQTWRYVQQALDFAQQGKADLAESCARYAESSIRLAARHLSAEDYQDLRDEVMARLMRSSQSPTP